MPEMTLKNEDLMIIDHIGIVVPSLAAAVERWTGIFGYHPMTGIVTNTRQKVKVVFLQKENSVLIKLVEPLEKTSPVYQFALKGGGLHHLCFRCDNVAEETARLSSLGCRMLSVPEPGEAFENNQIAFVYVLGTGINIELIDTDLKASILDSFKSFDEK
jgi:methylmalonyl-CoA/ethylmalonyl-CoA epimerase